MNISFDAGSENIIWIVCLLTIFLIALIYIETRRKNKSFFASRILALIFITLALAGMSLKPVVLKPTSAEKAFLITNGSSSALVDSLTKVYKPDEIVDLRNDGNAIKDPFKNLVQFRKLLDDYQSWIVTGRSEDDNLNQFLKGKDVLYYPDGFKNGIQQINFQSKGISGSNWELNAIYFNKDSSITKIYLEASGQIRDSIEINKAGFQDFTLKMKITESAGRYLFNLIIKNGNNLEISKYQLPVIVEGQKQRKYLLLAGFPNFEWKYLKDYLSDRGDIVFYRSQISRDKYQTEVLNTTEAANVLMNKEFLDDFDLIILDNSAWENLNNRERNLLQQLTKEAGTSLLLSTQGQTLPQQEFFIDFQPDLNPYRNKSVVFGNTEINVVVELDDLQTTISKNQNLHDLLNSEDGNILAAYAFNGYGKQAVSIIPALYPFILKGEADKFNRVYQYLIEQTQKQTFKDKYWSMDGIYPIVSKEAVQLKLKTIESDIDNQSIEALVISPKGDTTSLSPLQDYQISEDYNYSFWSANSGWYQVVLHQDSLVKDWFYVDSDTAWQSLETATQIGKNSFEFAQMIDSGINFNSSETFNSWRIPVWYFFIILLLGLSFLWLISKL